MRYAGGIAETVGFIMIFLSFATLLLHAAPFKILTAEQSAPAQKLDGKRGPLYKAFFIILFTLIPVLTFVPTYVYGENNVKQTALFPFNPSSSGYLLWTIANSVLMLIVFLIWHFAYGKKHGGNLKVYGLAFEDKKTAPFLYRKIRSVCPDPHRCFIRRTQHYRNCTECGNGNPDFLYPYLPVLTDWLIL